MPRKTLRSAHEHHFGNSIVFTNAKENLQGRYKQCPHRLAHLDPLRGWILRQLVVDRIDRERHHTTIARTYPKIHQFVQSVPRDSLTFTLQSASNALRR